MVRGRRRVLLAPGHRAKLSKLLRIAMSLRRRAMYVSLLVSIVAEVFVGVLLYFLSPVYGMIWCLAVAHRPLALSARVIVVLVSFGVRYVIGYYAS